MKKSPPANDDRCILRKARVIPWGYKVHELDSDWLVPIPEQLQALEKAFEYVKTCSYREVAAWLSKTTGRYISHVGLRLIGQRQGKTYRELYRASKAENKGSDTGASSQEYSEQTNTGAS